MNETVAAIILKQTDYREADVIISVLTKEYGKLSFVASGARKMKSKNAGSIMPCTIADIQFDHKPGKTMFRLKTARTRNLFRVLHEDLVLSAAASAACESADVLSLAGGEEENSAEKYELLETCLSCLNEKKDPDLVLCGYLAEMMDLFGILPDVDECVRCGSLKVSAFSAREGGFLCQDCARQLDVPLRSPLDLKRLRLAVKTGLAHYDAAAATGENFHRELRDLISVLQLHAGIEIRAFSFYNRLFDH